MMALRREEGHRVQHGWAEIKCERQETPIAHSGSPWNLSGPPKGYTLYSRRLCPTHCKIRYEVPSSCTTRYNNRAIVGIYVQFKMLYFTKKQPLWNPNCQQVSAVDLTVVHSKQGSYKWRKKFGGFGFFKDFFRRQTIPKKIHSFSLFFWVSPNHCTRMFLKLSAVGPVRDCAKVSSSQSFCLRVLL